MPMSPSPLAKKILQENEICCKARYLDVVNKKGSRKYYYNSNFVGKFLELYNKAITTKKEKSFWEILARRRLIVANVSVGLS